jgi:hypothetical protein
MFFGTQTAYMIDQPALRWSRCAQLLSAFLLIISAIVTVSELRPRNYIRYSPSNGSVEERLAFLRLFYQQRDNAETLVSRKITEDQIQWVKERITVNKGFNEKKASLLMLSFWTAVAAAAINSAILAVTHLFSQFH